MRKLLAFALLPLAAACAHGQKAAATAETKPAQAVEVQAPVAPPQPELGPALAITECTGDDACAANELCLERQCMAITRGMPECQVRSAYFDFDRAALYDVDLPPLRRAARCLAAGAEANLLVEGNCDERGTVEYNLALGYRRATAVREYLEQLGVPAGQIATVSYGKELPVCAQPDEICWARNRRADLLPNNKIKNIAALVRASEARQYGGDRVPAAAPAVIGRRPAAPSRPAAPREVPAASGSQTVPAR